MAQAFITRRGGSGGGVNQTLPAQITAFTATADNTPSVTLSWQNPTEYWAGTLIVKKAGSAPEGVNDGVKVYNGEGTSYTDFDVSFDTEYFYRAFPYNEKKQYQTVENVVSAKPLSGLKPSTLPVGSLIKMNVGDVATDFLVVHQGLPSSLYDDSCNGTWLLMKDVYEKREWHNSRTNDYENSTIHSYLNSTFLGLLNASTQSAVKQVKLPYRKGKGDDKTVTSGASGLPAKIFLLSATELSGNTSFMPIAEGEELSYFAGCSDDGADTKRVAYLNGSAVAWWLRSPYFDSENKTQFALTISVLGKVSPSYCNVPSGVRPALVLADNALLLPEPNADGSYTLME